MENGPGLKMYFLLKIFKNRDFPASYVIVYQRVVEMIQGKEEHNE